MTTTICFTAIQSLLALAIFLQHLENLKLANLPRYSEGFFRPQIYTKVTCLGLLAAALLPPLLLFAPVTPLMALTHAVLFGSIFMVALSFGGNFNGGADQMTMQISIALLIALFVGSLKPDLTELAQRFALLYITVQLCLSYFVSGVTKVINADWRSGKALQEILRSQNYDVATFAKSSIGGSQALSRISSWFVILLELIFPVVLIKPQLAFALAPIMLLFHLGNFMVLGLNRFVFIWLAAYPSIFLG